MENCQWHRNNSSLVEKFRGSQLLGWLLCSRKFLKAKVISSPLLCHLQYTSHVLRVQNGSRSSPHHSCALQSTVKKYMKKERKQKSVHQLSLREGSRNCHMTLMLALNWPKLNLILHQTVRDYREYIFLYST